MENSSFKVASNICLDAANVCDAGGFIKADEARTRLQNYFTATGYKPDDPKLVFGQLLGLDLFKSFIDRIDTYNAGSGAGGKKICAIRIYNAMSVRPELPAPDNTVKLPDVVIVPVFSDGTDLYSVVPLDGDDDTVLSDARPCPNECKTGLYSI